MLTRIVKMEFKAETIATFKALFREVSPKITAFEGCISVELLQDIHDPGIFFTYSHWENEYALNAYRHSQFFKETWARTKIHFNNKPFAWSVDQVNI